MLPRRTPAWRRNASARVKTVVLACLAWIAVGFCLSRMVFSTGEAPRAARSLVSDHVGADPEDLPRQEPSLLSSLQPQELGAGALSVHALARAAATKKAQSDPQATAAAPSSKAAPVTKASVVAVNLDDDDDISYDPEPTDQAADAAALAAAAALLKPSVTGKTAEPAKPAQQQFRQQRKPVVPSKAGGMSYTQLMQQRLHNHAQQQQQQPQQPQQQQKPQQKHLEQSQQPDAASQDDDVDFMEPEGPSAVAKAVYEAAHKAGALRTTDTHETHERCDNSCPMANDGKCDDGRNWKQHQQQAYASVGCDLGTDCKDCGPWKLHGARPSSGPVEVLRSIHGVKDLRVRLTATQPQIMFPYTDPQHDVDVSAQMDSGGGVELKQTKLVHKLLSGAGGCVRRDGTRRVFLDVGANFGWYSVYAATMGCRVIAWEPVPLFRAFLQLALQLNNVSHLVTVRNTAVSDAMPGTKLRLVVPSRGVWGSAGVDGLNIDSKAPGVELTELEVTSEGVDDVVMPQDDIALMKLDVEGLEPAAVRSAAGLLAARRVPEVLLEYSPGIAERNQQWGSLAQYPRMLLALRALGYQLVHVREKKGDGQEVVFGTPLDKLREVTEGNLKLDVRDALAAGLQLLGCPLPPDLKVPGWTGCNSVLHDLHPKSFRSMFVYNTDVWASLGNVFMRKDVPVGVMAWSQDTGEYFGPAGQDWGMMQQFCGHVGPREAIRLRCRCPAEWQSECGKAQEQVLELGKQGKLAQQLLEKLPELTFAAEELLMDVADALDDHEQALSNWRRAKAGGKGRQADAAAQLRIIKDVLKQAGPSKELLNVVYQNMLMESSDKGLAEGQAGVEELARLLLVRKDWLRVVVWALMPADVRDSRPPVAVEAAVASS